MAYFWIFFVPKEEKMENSYLSKIGKRNKSAQKNV